LSSCNPAIDQAFNNEILDETLDDPAVKAQLGVVHSEEDSMEEYPTEEFQPHVMVNPQTGEQRTVESMEQHLALMAEGWTHLDD